MPLKKSLKEKFEVSNMSDDLGRNNELTRDGQSPKEFRDY